MFRRLIKTFVFVVFICVSWFYVLNIPTPKEVLQNKAIVLLGVEMKEYLYKELNAKMSAYYVDGTVESMSSRGLALFNVTLLERSYKDIDIDKMKKIAFEIEKNFQRIIDTDEKIGPFLFQHPYPDNYLQVLIKPEFVLPEGEEGFSLAILTKGKMIYKYYYKEDLESGQTEVKEKTIYCDLRY